MGSRSDYVDFYSTRRSETYGDKYTSRDMVSHSLFREPLEKFISRYSLKDKRCLEIGSSGGCFQDMVDDYYGTDVSADLAKFYHKPYRVTLDGSYPFEDEMFDAIWTHAVFEHIPDLQLAMTETVRLLKPGGLLLFHPAWQCRTWVADGYPVRPYSDFGVYGRIVKASILIRDSVLWRSLFIFPKRFVRHLLYVGGWRPSRIKYKKINANYTKFWMSDSDACNSIDPHDAILWFENHGLRCLSHPMHAKAFFVRTGALTFIKTSSSQESEPSHVTNAS